MFSSSADADGCRGTVKRAVYLGPSIDYRVLIGTAEIRVQQDIHEALASSRIFKESETVGLRFLDLKWFRENSVMAMAGVAQ